MTRYISFILIFLMITSCKESFIVPTSTCSPDTSVTINSSHPKAARLQAKMDEYTAMGLPGATVLISDSNGIWRGSSGLADIENNVSMQPCIINKLGSITKMMMGSVVWTLIQEGKLNLDDPLEKHLPDAAEKITNGDKITLKMLLDHSSGIADIGANLNYNLAVVNDFTRSWTSEELVDFMAGTNPTNEPGEEVNYSNTNTLLIGMIVSKVTGEPQAEVLQERIFEPLGMTSTLLYNYGSAFPKANLAQGYLDFNNNGGSIQNISDLNPGSGNGYTGVYSTVTDLYKFMNALMVDKTIITNLTIADIEQGSTLSSSGSFRSSNYAIHQEYLKVLPDGVKAFGHAGGDIGYSANLNYLPHNETIYAGSFNYGTNLPTDLGRLVNQMREELLLIAAE